jgi:hypothetical protein
MLLDTTGHVELGGDDVGRQLDRAAAVDLLLNAYSGSVDVDAVVTAFVLAATRASVSAGSIGRTESSAMGSVRACDWDERGRRLAGGVAAAQEVGPPDRKLGVRRAR